MGSSPLSRGILPHPAIQLRSQRIIPALAGNTVLHFAMSQSGMDHPRSRGEYRRGDETALREVGSSPLSRGILGKTPSRRGFCRIIPALAGNTAVKYSGVPCGRDHPRSRGEYSSRPSQASPKSGSSPLSRGIRCRASPRPRAGRIIPALAGNTSGRAMRSRPVADHPRSRGEYIHAASEAPAGQGSSPLSRGIPPPT